MKVFFVSITALLWALLLLPIALIGFTLFIPVMIHDKYMQFELWYKDLGEQLLKDLKNSV